MKKNIHKIALVSVIMMLSSQTSMPSFAQDMPYEPVFENVQIQEAISTAKVEQPKTISSMTPIDSSMQNAKNTATNTTNSIESGNLQSALMQLDSAQVEIRNQLIQYKSEYANLDNQYRTLKEQRAAKAKLVKETEKKIKSLDQTKEKIRKNMN